MIERLRASAVCVHEGRLLAVKYRDPVSHLVYWGVPGGGVEAGEDPAETARRETLEETGYEAVVLKETHVVNQYVYVWAGREVHCTTHWFAATLTNSETAPSPVNDADYILETGWLPLSEISEKVNFHPVVLKTVVAMAM